VSWFGRFQHDKQNKKPSLIDFKGIEQGHYKASRLEQVLQSKYFSLYNYRIFEDLLFPNFEKDG
jgi:hypothetical protein